MSLYHQLQKLEHNGHPMSTVIINHVTLAYSLDKLTSNMGDDIIQTILTEWLSHPGTQSKCEFYIKRISFEMAIKTIERFFDDWLRQKKITEDVLIEDRLSRGDNRYPLTNFITFRRRRNQHR